MTDDETPTCPACGEVQGDVSRTLAPGQAACTNGSCAVITWDVSKQHPRGVNQ